MSTTAWAWLWLVAAGLCEVVWAVGLRYVDGVRKPLALAVVVVGLVASMAMLAKALQTLPLGTAYAVWVGIGAVGTAVYGMTVLGEPATAARLVFLVMLIAAIVGLKLTAPAA